MKRIPAVRIFQYSLPIPTEGTPIKGRCVIVPEEGADPSFTEGHLVLGRNEFATALRLWRRIDTTARRVPPHQRINGLLLFLIRHAITA